MIKKVFVQPTDFLCRSQLLCKANSCVRVPRRPATTARHYNAAIQANGLVRLDAPRSRESTLQCASVPTGTRICRSGKNDALGYVVDFRHSFRRRTRVTPHQLREISGKTWAVSICRLNGDRIAGLGLAGGGWNLSHLCWACSYLQDGRPWDFG